MKILNRIYHPNKLFLFHLSFYADIKLQIFVRNELSQQGAEQ